MGIEENKGIVRRFLDEVVSRGDMDVVNELCTTDAVNHAAAPDRQQGIENIRAVIEFSRRAQPDQRWVEQHVVAEGDLDDQFQGSGPGIHVPLMAMGAQDRRC